jgi:hypothetical protein
MVLVHMSPTVHIVFSMHLSVALLCGWFPVDMPHINSGDNQLWESRSCITHIVRGKSARQGYKEGRPSPLRVHMDYDLVLRLVTCIRLWNCFDETMDLHETIMDLISWDYMQLLSLDYGPAWDCHWTLVLFPAIRLSLQTLVLFPSLETSRLLRLWF